MKSWRMVLALLLTLVMATLPVGCDNTPTSPGEPPAASDPNPTTTAAVFFADWQAQHLMPEARELTGTKGLNPATREAEEDLATKVVRAILAGPTDPHLHRTLPAEVKLLGPVTIRENVAYVNLSKELLNVRGAAGVTMALGSLRLSLTEMAGISKVQVLVEGKTDVVLDEGLLLEPMGRGLYLSPVLVDEERALYLKERLDQGQDTWRVDPARTVQWDGRMFGFSRTELETARVLQDDEQTAKARFRRGDLEYTIELKLIKGVWMVTGVTQAPQAVPFPADSGSNPTMTVPVFFSDREAFYLIPEARQVTQAQGADLATLVVQEVLKGPSDPFLRSTFPEDVRLLPPVKVEQGIAYVNLSREVLKVQGSTGTGLALGSLVLSLTEIPGVEKVYVRTEGERSVLAAWQRSDETVGRGPVWAYQVKPDLDRADYLQERANQGIETWRTDQAKVLAWEGRMFHFTRSELEAASIRSEGDRALATVKQGQKTYTVTLKRHAGIQPGIWTIQSIS